MHSVIKSGPGRLTTVALYCNQVTNKYNRQCNSLIAKRNGRKQLAGQFKCRKCDSIIDVALEYSDHSPVLVDSRVPPQKPS
jgi:hypothetical protein